MVTEIRRQRSRKALVEVSLCKGRVGALKPPHGPFSIHWARSSSPVLQQLPARLVRVNKPSAKVKETYKKDIMQTVISLEPAEPQIEWHNHLCSFFHLKVNHRKVLRFPAWLAYEFNMSRLYTSTRSALWIQKTERQSVRLRNRQSLWRNYHYLLLPL